MITFLEP